MSEELKIPSHIAIIMDGNGRWAKKRFQPRAFGHKAGAERLEDVSRWADELGVKYLTVYAFSTENWNRPFEEVTTLMNLLRMYMKKKLADAKKNNLVIRMIGDRSKLDKDIILKIEEIEEVTKFNTGLHLQIALNYGGRDEIVRAVKKLANDVENNKLKATDVEEKMLESYLDTKEIPDPELLIRTSGEMRLSNYLLWQLAYTEFYFTDVLWPDFNKEELMNAIYFFNKRDRRFGGL
ncbi:MAG: uppS [Clostridiales bacterium]|jgi:undecaprenyl diphosphate synthase|nr:uppS [Clostridiales bacterium]